MNSYETIVIGTGAVGSAALYQVSKRSSNVLGIDQFSPPHSLGSSHGDTRITRQAIGEGAQFTPLSLRSYEIFQDLEKLTAKTLLRMIGGLMISGEGSIGVHGVADFFENTLAAAKAFNIRHETLNSAEIRKRFPQFNITNNDFAYYEYNAGYLFLDECIRAQLMLAEDNGAEIHRNENVISVKESGNEVVVTTNHGEYKTQKVVLTAGPWLPDFISADLSKYFKIERQVQYWFDIESAYRSFSEDFPIFIWETPVGGHIYGFPAIDGARGGFKLGSSKYNKIVTASTIDRVATAEETNLMFNQQVKPFFPSASENCVRTAVCLYTSTPNAGFVIDQSPECPSVLICSPCSGHGFKHSAAIGEAIAELIIAGYTTLDISAFKLEQLRR